MKAGLFCLCRGCALVPNTIPWHLSHLVFVIFFLFILTLKLELTLAFSPRLQFIFSLQLCYLWLPWANVLSGCQRIFWFDATPWAGLCCSRPAVPVGTSYEASAPRILRPHFLSYGLGSLGCSSAVPAPCQHPPASLWPLCRSWVELLALRSQAHSVQLRLPFAEPCQHLEAIAYCDGLSLEQ